MKPKLALTLVFTDRNQEMSIATILLLI
jgi:hypothetical protein